MMTKVIYYSSLSGQNPIGKFLDSLSARQQAKILKIIENIKRYGLNSVLPHLKKLSGTPLWEIRVLGQDNIRVIYAVLYLDAVLILHGFIKKSQKTPEKEIDVALVRFNEYKKDVDK